MIQFVAYCVCLIVATGLASPVPNSEVDFSAKARQIVSESYIARVGPNSTITPGCPMGYITIAEDAGDVFFYLAENRLPPESEETKRIELNFNEREKDKHLSMVGTHEKLEVGSDAYTRGMKAYTSGKLPAGHLFKVNISKIYLEGPSGARIVLDPKEYYAGTDL